MIEIQLGAAVVLTATFQKVTTGVMVQAFPPGAAPVDLSPTQADTEGKVYSVEYQPTSAGRWTLKVQATSPAAARSVALRVRD